MRGHGTRKGSCRYQTGRLVIVVRLKALLNSQKQVVSLVWFVLWFSGELQLKLCSERSSYDQADRQCRDYPRHGQGENRPHRRSSGKLFFKYCPSSYGVEQILQAIGVDYIDESEVLTPADDEYHINKHGFKVPFVCGARDLGEALRRIGEGAAMIRTKGEAGTGNVVEAVRHQRAVMSQIRKAGVMTDEELYAFAKEIQAPYHLLKETARLKRLPVVNFAAGGIATPGMFHKIIHILVLCFDSSA